VAGLALNVTVKSQTLRPRQIQGNRNLPCEANTTSILLQVRVIQAPMTIHQPVVLADGWRANLLLHRQGPRPRVVVLRFILILMVWLVLSVDLVLSIVEIVGSCHSRQSSGDFRSLSFGREWKPSACIGSVQNALQLMYSSLQFVLAADTTASGYGNNWIVGWRCFWGVGRAGAAGDGSTGRIVGDGHDDVACLGVVRLLPVNSNDRKIERYTDCRHGLDCAPVDGWR